MSIEPTHRAEHDRQSQTTLEHDTDASKKLSMIQIGPEDTFEQVLMTLRLQSEPLVLLLPEGQSQAFSTPSDFARLREIYPSKNIHFLIPQSRIGTAARYAHHYGFPFASSQEKASPLLMVQQREQAQTSHEGPRSDDSPEAQEKIVEDTESPKENEQHTIATEQSPQSAIFLQKGSSRPALRSHSLSRRRGLVATLIALLVVAGVVLFPALFSAQPELTSTQQPEVPAAASVGQVAFTSSGQLDPASSRGLNDTITMSLHNLSMPAHGQSYYAWLMPDPTDDNTLPFLLGRLRVADGKADITSIHPDHTNLLAAYSGFEVTEQPSNQMPTTPPLDLHVRRYTGNIPNTPMPGDTLHYSQLNHIRHLLAQDPTLQDIGLQGGLDIWLYRNSEKILEWSSAARDTWAGGKQTDLVHRHMIRVLDYLDGAASVYTSGDVPAGSPLLVDPQVGRVGLLAVRQTQALPAYLTHVDVHLRGFIAAPGHSQAQKQLAIKIDNALTIDTSLFQKVRQDAIRLVRMNEAQLKSNATLSLLNDMVTNANTAYTGQLDPTLGGNINGIVWIHNELQGIATMQVTVVSAKTQ